MRVALERLRGRQEGFTLIELLVVVAIIALLTAFAIPSLYQAINKSKSSKDQVAVDTISGAMERYYLDNGQYPKGATPDTLEADLKANFVKSSTKFVNEFKQGFIYMTDSSGGYYILVDPQNNDAVSITCNGKEEKFAKTASGTAPDETTAFATDHLTWHVSGEIVTSDAKSTCTVTPNTLKLFTNF